MENLTSQVMNKRNEGIFDEFYLFYLDKMEESLDRILNKNLNFEFDKNDIVTDAICALKNNLIEMGSKTLLAELNKYKEERKADCTYEEYVSHISDNQFHIYFNEKYSVLNNLLEQRVNTFIELFEECITRLSVDKEKIEEEFGVKIKSVNHVAFSEDGDTHNGGKSVICLDVNDGKTLFYKPHNLAMDVIFREIIRIIEEHLDKFKYEHVKTIDRSDYGWQEMVEYRESKDYEELRNYYYSVGVTLAIFYLLGTEDIHSGNLISKGDMPAFIDLEILMANKSKNTSGCDENNEYIKLNKKLIDSVLGVYLLPNNFAHNLIDIDICALTSGQSLGEHSEKLSYFDLVDRGTANIHYEKIPSESFESLSIVKREGKVVEADAYIDDIAEGFEDAYKVIMDEKKRILDILVSHREDKIRQVLRATYIYAKFLDAAYHPKYLKSFSERRRVLSLINGKKSNIGIKNQISEKELEMLYRDDIPYFYTKYDSRDLYCTYDGKENVIKNVFADSVENSVHRKISRLSNEDMLRQIDLIYLSFANFGRHSIKKFEKQDRRLCNRLEQNIDLNLKDRYPKSIYESILDRCIDVDDISSIVGLDPDIKGNYRISYLSGNLYNGLGLTYFLSMVDGKYENRNQEKILRLIKGIEAVSPFYTVSDNICSAYNGLVGRLYVYKQLHKQTGLVEYDSYYNKILDYLVNKDLKEGDVIDYVTGVSGGIVGLANLFKADNDWRLKVVIDKCIEFIREKVEKLNYENTLNGMAHGYSGLITALFKIYEFNEDEYFYDKAIELVKKENASYSDSKGNWKDTRDGKYDMVFWCHGAAGIGLTRAATLKYVEHEETLRKIWLDDINNAVSIVKKEGLGFELKHGICHGVMGNMIILDYIAKVTHDKDLEKYIKLKLNEFLNEVDRETFHNENKLNIQDVGFMLGLSGIGYSIMRLTDKDIPNILLLEV